MNSTSYRLIFVLFILICFWLTPGGTSKLCAQMTSVVNSAADDSLAYPWDDPNTENIDESVDGICGDAGGRCTLRAALDEAANMGQFAKVTFVSDMIITLRKYYSLSPPSGSTIDGSNKIVVIQGADSNAFLMQLQDVTTIRGLWFTKAMDAVDVMGNGNVVGGGTYEEGNVFLGMKQNAILLGGDNNLVIGNKIGIYPANTGVDGNKFGIFVIGSNNTIGGVLPGQRNIISFSKFAGIAIAADTTGGAGGGNRVIGNYIGTDTSGTLGVPNLIGIEVLLGHDVTIGGPGVGQRNLISGNISAVEVGIEARDVTIQGNYIGTDASGTSSLGNRDGVTLAPGANYCIVENNLIRGNTAVGVLISGGAGVLATTHNRISGNKIVHNAGHGILLAGNATDNVIGSSLTQNYDSNQVQFNGTGGGLGQGGGVYITENSQGTPKKNTIRKNSFLDNLPFGISLELSTSVQDNIVPPTIITYEDAGPGNVSVTGRHNRPGSIIDVYAGEKNVGTTFQGRRWLGSDYVDLDSTFSVPITNACNCTYLVATATDIMGNTSEFSSPAFQVMNTTISAQFNLKSGWNMVSVPVGVSNFQSSALFSGALGNMYSYQGSGYTPQTTLTQGTGYWARYASAANFSMTGTPSTSDTINLTTKWNLIGSVSTPVPVSSIVTVPPGLVTTNLYYYNAGYQVADTIQPGKAYWARSNGSGTMILNGSGNVPSTGGIKIVHTDELPPPPPDGTQSASDNNIPADYAAVQNYPNPFNPSTTIQYSLPVASRVTLKIFDVLGREIATLVDGMESAGNKSVRWDADKLTSGIYFYKLEAGQFTTVKKLVLSK